MSTKSGASGQVISLPKGGGALQGIGEKFSPDLHTGTGNFTVLIALPPGRNGFQPQINLVYSTGNGNGPFGLGWSLSVPGVSRRTAKGIPRYDDARDTFILSGAEDLVPVEQLDTARTRYQPRTEGLFARVVHHHSAQGDYWFVQSKDGLVSRYGTPRPDPTPPNWRDPAITCDPDLLKQNIFAWKLTETRDPFGNLIQYDYLPDAGKVGAHEWNQPLLAQIRYVDYTDQNQTRFLVSVTFEYEDRPDPYSDYRAGFEIRTTKRCARMVVRTHAGQDRLVREYRFDYDSDSHNAVSLVKHIMVIGYDDAGAPAAELPPLEFGYTRFQPERRSFEALSGDLPASSLANQGLDLVDLFGNGLPDILEMNGAVRYWRNLGDGRFDTPRAMRDAPAGLALADPGVQMVDANGDGRTDLLVTKDRISGYYPLRFGGLWDRHSFQRYRQAPSFNLEDPEVKLVDLDGDGVTDAIRSGSRLECFFNDPHTGWNGTRWVERRALDVFPNVNFSDPRVKWGDLSGDGLQDIVLVSDGSVSYWPNLGRGDWGKRIRMQRSPRFPYGYDPRRILVGDVDGDGLADIVYVDRSVQVQHQRVHEASEGVALAELQIERAQIQVDGYNSLISAGLNQHELQAIALLEQVVGLHDKVATLYTIAALLPFSITDTLYTANMTSGTSISFTVSPQQELSLVAQSKSAQAASKSTEAQIHQIQASFERTKEQWELQKDIAEQDLEIGKQQVRVAQAHVGVARAELRVAQMQVENAEAVINFLGTKFTNVELYNWMSGVLGGVYRYFLQQAAAMAMLAQHQLAFERQQPPPSFILADYWRPQSQSGNKGPDRRGLTGSARLLEDIYQLDQYAFKTDQRKLDLAQTFSLARLDPIKFQQFRETGVLGFRTSMSLFDRAFPGHYLRLLKRVRVSVIALIPPVDGIRATLRTSTGFSRVVIGGDFFKEAIIRHDPDVIALTAPSGGTGVFEMDAQPDLLLPFEGMGVDAQWELEMPKAANRFDYRTIADVLFTVEYTALHSFDYRDQVIQRLDRSVSEVRGFSFRNEFADAWYDLHNPDQSATPMAVRFSTRREDFPPNIENLMIQEVMLYFARAEGKTFEVDVSSLHFTPDGSGQTLGGPGGTTNKGQIGTLLGNAGGWLFIKGTPIGEWELALPNTELIRQRFKDEEIEDILLAITFVGDGPAWSS